MSAKATETFADIERALNEWVERAVELPDEPAPPVTETELPRLFAERLQRLQTYLETAKQNAEQVLAPLSSNIEECQHWLDALAKARAKLDECTARGV